MLNIKTGFYIIALCGLLVFVFIAISGLLNNEYFLSAMVALLGLLYGCITYDTLQE